MTITFNGNVLPATIAAKIGAGSFAAQTLSGSTLTLSIPVGTNNYAVAYVCPAELSGKIPVFQEESVWEASIADGTSQNFSCPSSWSQGTLTGSLDATAVPGVQSFQISAQNGDSLNSVSQGSGSTASFSLSAPVGSDRVLVLAYANPGSAPVAAANLDNQTVPGALNGGNTVIFGASDETTPEAISYNNVPTGYSAPDTFVALLTGGSSNEISLASGATTQYAVLPASATEKGEVYFLSAGAYENGSLNITLVSTGIATSGGPVSFSFPAPWSYSGPTPAALPEFNMSYTGFSGGANVTQDAFIQWNPEFGTAVNAFAVISIEATANYQSGATTLAIPDLSSVSGFITPPASGMPVSWLAWIQEQSYGLTSRAPLNGTFSQVSNSGSFKVP